MTGAVGRPASAAGTTPDGQVAAGRLAGKASARRPAGQRAMGTWRLEWLRLVRTPRLIALAAVYVAFGLIEPVATKYTSQLVKHVSPGVQIKFPPVVPAQGVGGYVSNISTIGLIVVVVISAGALGFDAHRGVATFLRTRVRGMWQLIGPRFTVNALAASAAYLLGTLAAWYETTLLIGHLPAGQMAAGVLCEWIYLTFAVAITAAAASVTRSAIGTAGLSLAALLVLPLVGIVHAVHDWLPSTLVSAPYDLLTGEHLAHFLPSAAVTVAASALALAITTGRLRAREL
jgi:ABC-2 type transport system permease protein